MSTTRARDSQKTKVYTAEYEALKYYRHAPEHHYPEMADLRVAVDKIISAKWYREQPWPQEIEIYNGAGCRKAFGGRGYIKMPRWSRHIDVILHEIAHGCTLMQYGGPFDGVAWHGWQFCDIELRLVRHFLGQEAHDALKASFKKHKVRYTAPRKRKPMTEEQREAARERLAHARAVKAARRETVAAVG